jgi:hypothetical protein
MKTSHFSIIVILTISIFTVWMSNAEGHGVQSPPSTIIPPLKMLEEGYSITDVKCNLGLSLVIKIKDSSPACVKPDTVQRLIGRGWGESLQSLLASPLKMEITGLNQTYETGHVIIATIKYTGYEHGRVYPDVKILDANGTQVWSNCCITHTETPSMHFGTFTYDVQGSLWYPAINKTGTYTMIASLDNETTDAIFDVIQSNKTQANSPTKITNHETPSIFPGRIILSSCGGGAVQYHTSSNILNSTGFDIYHNVMNYSHINNDDYVIQPGTQGTITYVIEAGSSPTSHLSFPVQKELNITNYAIFYHHITDYEELLHNPSVTINGGDYNSCFKRPNGSCAGLSGPITGPIDAIVVDHPGVNVSFEPANELLQYNDTAKGKSSQIITMTVHVDTNSSQGTYWVILSPEECLGGEIFLFTVGDEPFHK